MAFLLLCLILAFLGQIVVLSQTKKLVLRLIPLLFMELLLLTGAAYYGIKKPAGFLFDHWTYNLTFCLWLAGAVLFGCVLAWGAYVLHNGGRKDK